MTDLSADLAVIEEKEKKQLANKESLIPVFTKVVAELEELNARMKNMTTLKIAIDSYHALIVALMDQPISSTNFATSNCSIIVLD